MLEGEQLQNHRLIRLPFTIDRSFPIFSGRIEQHPRPSGRLRNNEHLSHRYFGYLSLAKASREMWRFLHRNTAINGANCSLWSSLSLGRLQRIFTFELHITSQIT